MIDLIPFCTPRQEEYVLAVQQYGGVRKAAKELGVSHAVISNSIKAVKVKAAKHGYAPEHDMTKTCPEGFMVKGVSTYYNEDGKPTAQWVKTNIDLQKQMEFIQEGIAAFLADLPKITPPKPHNSLSAIFRSKFSPVSAS